MLDWLRSVLGPEQLPLVQSRYPHMLDQDCRVWSDWLKLADMKIEAVWYDVKLGTPIPLPPEASDEDRRLAIGCGCKRVDALLLVQGQIWIIEVKPYGNHAALGQALTYRQLWRAKYGLGGQPLGVIVCETADVDIRKVAGDFGVWIFETSNSPS